MRLNLFIKDFRRKIMIKRLFFNRRVATAAKVIIFFSIFAYLFLHISYIVRPELAHTRGNLGGYYAQQNETLDVVFVGTSGTFSAWVPMIAWENYGFTSYNFCVNVMGYETLSFAVKEAMKTQKPRVLVIDIYPFIINHSIKSRNDSETRYNTDGWKYSLDYFSFLWKELSENKEKLTYIFDFVKYHNNDFNWNNYAGEYPYLNKGYNFLPWITAKPAELTDEVVSMDKDRCNYLEDLISICKEIDTNVLFLYYPWGNVSDTDIGNINYIQKKIEEHGASFFNCELIRDEFSLDYGHDFWGESHCNIYGAEKITNVLGAYLQKRYQLEDKRGDTSYSDWNDDLGEWKGKVIQQKQEIDKQIQQAGAQ